jgi:hypothetical protein
MTGLVNRLVKKELLSIEGPVRGMLCERYRRECAIVNTFSPAIGREPIRNLTE